MTPFTAAQRLDKCQYRREGSPELFGAMAKAGLVAIYGASDDLVMMSGAVSDEADAGPLYFNKEGMTEGGWLAESECEDDACPYFEKVKGRAAIVTPRWCHEGSPPWSYSTEITHETFDVLEDDEVYCRGIVISLRNLQPQRLLRLVTATDIRHGSMLLHDEKLIMRILHSVHGYAGIELIKSVAKNMEKLLSTELSEEGLSDEEYLKLLETITCF